MSLGEHSEVVDQRVQNSCMSDAGWTTVHVAPIAPGISVDTGDDQGTREPRPVVCLLHQTNGPETRVVLGVLDAHTGGVAPIAEMHRISWQPNWGPGPS